MTYLSQRQGLEHWKNFYSTHKKYRKVGRVSHAPIDPMSPIPEHCNPKKATTSDGKAAEKGAASAETAAPPLEEHSANGENVHVKHNEL